MKELKSIIIIIILVFAISNCELITTEGKVTSNIFPKELSNVVDTIEVTYIAWACACANWLPTEYLEDPNYETTENSDDCIFIEAENKDLKIPEEYHLSGYRNRIKLIGQFYKDEGISKDYQQPTSQKPEGAKVFRYTDIEVIKPYTIWNFEDNDEDGLAKVKTIAKGEQAFYDIENK